MAVDEGSADTRASCRLAPWALAPPRGCRQPRRLVLKEMRGVLGCLGMGLGMIKYFWYLVGAYGREQGRGQCNPQSPRVKESGPTRLCHPRLPPNWTNTFFIYIFYPYKSDLFSGGAKPYGREYIVVFYLLGP
jgi:hypothetical protein